MHYAMTKTNKPNKKTVKHKSPTRTTISLDASVLKMGKRLAKEQRRTFSNWLAVVILREFNAPTD